MKEQHSGRRDDGGHQAEAQEWLDVAAKAAREAGGFLLETLDRPGEVGYKGEGHRNPFSRADREAERIVLDILGRSFPDHSFLSEEAGRAGEPSDHTWVIDPLDGTVNFIHGVRYFAVSIALVQGADIVLGVVYNPAADEMFSGAEGRGAYLNGEKIRVSSTARLDESLLAAGFPYDRRSPAFDRSARRFACLAREGQAARRDGSTALALCNVACGRYDGFCVEQNDLWDYAAGILLVSEAGGKVTDFDGRPYRVGSSPKETLASNGTLHQAILGCIATSR